MLIPTGEPCIEHTDTCLDRHANCTTYVSGIPEGAYCLLPDGEAYKSWETLNKIFDELLANRCERKTPLIALGGGVIGDLTGFAAATLPVQATAISSSISCWPSRPNPTASRRQRRGNHA